MKTKRKWGLKEQAFFLKRLCSMLDKGYTLSEALNFLYVNEVSRRKDDLLNCLSQLSAGHSFRHTLSNLHFHKDVLSYLYFAEQHGDLEFALRECCDILTKKVTHIDKLGKILRYPIFLILTVSFILSIVQAVITPQFEQLYDSMNIEASFFSSTLLVIFAFLKWVGIASVISIIFITSYYLLIYRKKSVEAQMKLVQKIPVLRKVVSMLHSYFFSLQLSNLLRGGLSTFDSLKIFEKQTILPFFKTEADYLISKLKAGEQLHNIIKSRGYYEPELSLVIIHGQANGQLARELYMYSQLLLEKLENQAVKTMTIIQPVIYAFVGIIVLFVYLSMLLPMYKMMENI